MHLIAIRLVVARAASRTPSFLLAQHLLDLHTSTSPAYAWRGGRVEPKRAGVARLRTSLAKVGRRRNVLARIALALSHNVTKLHKDWIEHTHTTSQAASWTPASSSSDQHRDPEPHHRSQQGQSSLFSPSRVRLWRAARSEGLNRSYRRRCSRLRRRLRRCRRRRRGHSADEIQVRDISKLRGGDRTQKKRPRGPRRCWRGLGR